MYEREALLSNASFMRYAAGFEVYQRLFAEAETPSDRDQIRNRMRALHVGERQKQLAEAEGDEQMMVASSLALAEDILRQCEQGDFTAQLFADALLSSRPGQELIASWTSARLGAERQGPHDINIHDDLSGHFDDDERTQLSLHIRPINAAPQEVMSRVREALRRTAAELQSGAIRAERIMMTSWLLNRKTAAWAFGDDVPFETVDHLRDKEPALQYNQKILERYLRTGKLPAVGRVTLSKEEFIRRVSSS